MQIKAGFKKEWYFFSRTFRMWGVLIGIFAFALLDPALFKMIDVLMANVQTDQNVSISAMLGMSEMSAGLGVYAALTDITANGLLIMLLLLMGTAGGEQKKRSVIIPSCAGLSPLNYTLPKFIFYPLFTFCATVLGTLVSGGLSLILFGGTLDWGAVIGAGALAGFYMAFITTAMLMAGICTGHAGISVAIIYILTTLLPLILQGLNADKYNPFTLKSMALMLPTGEQPESMNLWASIGITIILMLIFFFVTLFVQNAKKIENEGNEAVL